MKTRRIAAMATLAAVLYAAVVAAAGPSASAAGPSASAASPSGSAAATGCSVGYRGISQWRGGFIAGVSITNLGAPIDGWTLTFNFVDSNQIVVSGWSGTWRQDGMHVGVSSIPANGRLGTNASTSIGFTGTYVSDNPPPVGFALNGVACAEIGERGPATPGA
jgi:endoglucanase